MFQAGLILGLDGAYREAALCKGLIAAKLERNCVR